MADFNLKLAGSIVPSYDGSPKTLKDFLDCASYYDDTLKVDAKPQFLSFLLKVKLKLNAKLALTSTPASLAQLEKLLKHRFKPRATTASKMSWRACSREKSR